MEDLGNETSPNCISVTGIIQDYMEVVRLESQDGQILEVTGPYQWPQVHWGALAAYFALDLTDSVAFRCTWNCWEQICRNTE